MIGISKLYCGQAEAGDELRYARRETAPPRPIVVWNCTRRCNLRCAHCYADSPTPDSPTPDSPPDGELSDAQARAMIDDVAAFGVPVLLFSGGEPLLRPGVLELARYAKRAGLRVVFSTNGTLLTRDVAREMQAVGVSYAGISLDGLAAVNDAFRGQAGAFERAVEGIRACRAAGVKVGLRMTMNRHNVGELGGVFDLIQRESIPRACFYHLVASGRGRSDDALSHAQTRSAVGEIIDRTADLHARGLPVQILTVDNHADGPFLRLRMARENHARAAEASTLLRRNGGNSSGSGIACVSWNGDVLPDQFWRGRVVGNVTRQPFGIIWSDGGHELLTQLRRRRDLLTGRCRRCRWLGECNGNLRARADGAGDLWGDDPACYLTDEEIV